MHFYQLSRFIGTCHVDHQHENKGDRRSKGIGRFRDADRVFIVTRFFIACVSGVFDNVAGGLVGDE